MLEMEEYTEGKTISLPHILTNVVTNLHSNVYLRIELSTSIVSYACFGIQLKSL